MKPGLARTRLLRAAGYGAAKLALAACALLASASLLFGVHGRWQGFIAAALWLAVGAAAFHKLWNQPDRRH